MACEFCADDEDRLSDFLDQTAIMNLVTAIVTGTTADALLNLDIIFRDDPGAREWIAQAKTRALRAAV